MSTSPRLVPLWTHLPDADPDATPHLEIYLPEIRDIDSATEAVVIFPGGGYGMRAAHEAGVIGQYFAQRGLVGLVAHYRVSPNRFPAPVADGCRAVRMARSLAGELGFAADRVALIGFSAGGHLAATIGTQPDLYRDPHDDLPFSARPDRLVLCYPVTTFLPPHGHEGSAQNFLGDDLTEENRRRFDAPSHVSAETPPTFLFHTVADQPVPVQNSLRFAAACADKKVPFALHVFTPGRHGVGLAADDPALRAWPELLTAWLKSAL